MYDFKKLFQLVKEINKTFSSSTDGTIEYSTISQISNIEFLKQFAEDVGVFEKTKEKEKNNIEVGLTIKDKQTNEDIQLIDIDSMFERVDNVFSIKNQYDCIKALAISNKCAHAFDSTISSLEKRFLNLYNSYTGENLKKVSFMRPFEDECSKIDKTNSQFKNLVNGFIIKDGRYLTNKEFLGIYELLNPNKKNLNPISTIKQILNNLNVSYENDSAALILYKYYCDNKKSIYEAYLRALYNNVASIVALQSAMFSIKCNYLSMIAQLISNGTFKDIKCELVQTGGKEGFKHMLIIDDSDLSYYVEVHMPDYLKEELVNNYGFTVKNKRSTLSLGASAVYRRDEEEIEKIKQALEADELDNSKNRAKTRGKIISRKITPISDESKMYSFETKAIPQTSIPFLREFLREYNIHKYDDILRFTSQLLENENYSVEQTLTIANNYDYNIYLSLDEGEQDLFISFSIYGVDENRLDEFDKELIDALRLEAENNEVFSLSGIAVNKDLIPRVLIEKDLIKRRYFKNPSSKSIKAYINDIIEEYNKEMSKEILDEDNISTSFDIKEEPNGKVK